MPAPAFPRTPAGAPQPGAMMPPPRPALAVPPRPALRRGLWALPLLISLAFVAAVLTWLRSTEQAELDEQRTELISDALSLQSQVSARIEREAVLLDEFAAVLARRNPAPETLAGLPEVQQGLRRFWVGLTWLDAANRIVAHVPEQSLQPDLPSLAGAGRSGHLRAPLASGGALVARYSPSDMLRQTVPWWLARKYDVRLVDSFGDVMASTTDGREARDGGVGQAGRPRQSHRISLEPTLNDGYLELIARDRITPWYRSLPVAMVAGFVVLIAAITWLLRRQVMDVSRAEEAWRTEAAWRSAMEDSLTVGLRARDLDGRVLYVNRALADMVGYAPEELNGRLPPMPYWPSDSIEASMLRHRRNMAGDAPRGGYETRWRHREGRPIDVILFEAPLVDARGRHIGWMGSILDITERKRLEERERRQTETMAHHARLTMLGEIASTLAHELNQPLTAISSYNAGVLNSLQRVNATPPIDPLVLRALQRLGEQAAHAGRIVQRIREFLTRREPRLEACALNGVVEGAAALLQRELARQRVQFTLALDPQLPSVVADAVLIEQVVINLIRNACDALGEQPEAPDRPRTIEARTRRTPDQRFVRIDVRDNGPGLQGRRIEALCAPFYSTKLEGMGMGLAICRSILEAHQGALDATEAPGGGAWFSMTLPVDLQLTVESPEDAANAAPDAVATHP
ncbi:MAG: PAS domain S-box protein [Bacteriovorax sp.]|nr:PAS domain S-box protein [Rhizobacter sp.]